MIKLKKLTDQEIIGQLFFISIKTDQVNTRADREKIKRKFFHTYPPGGVLVSGGSPERVFATVQWLQSISRVPLWIAADVERGLSGVFSGGTDFPHFAMAGAVDSPGLVKQMGKAIARECRAVGINLLFAPVADRLTANPIINIRAFHEQPEQVIEFTKAFCQGVFEEGLLPVIKHFPGHGPALNDSHLQTATLPKKQFDESNPDYAVFLTLIKTVHYAAIMSGHLLPEDAEKIVTFDGTLIQAAEKHTRNPLLLITDDLHMGGCRFPEGQTPGESLFNSHHHHFLNPPNYRMAADQIREFTREDRNNSNELYKRVQNILSFKKRFIGSVAPLLHFQQIYKHTATTAHKKTAEKIARSGIVALEAQPDFNSLKTNDSVDHVIIAPDVHLSAALNTFRQKLRAAPIHYREYCNTIPENGQNTNRIIVSFYQRTYAGVSFLEMGSELNTKLKQLASQNQLCIISWGNVFIYKDIFLNLDGMKLWVPSYMPVAQKAVYDALWGKFSIQGTLPVTLDKRHQAGTKITLSLAGPPTAWNRSKNDPVQKQFSKAIAEQAITGAAAFVYQKHQIQCWTEGTAKNVRNNTVPVDEESLFDLASLTKIYSTTLLVLHLISQKKLSPDDCLGFFFSRCPDIKKDITIRQLLSHTAGLKSWLPLYESASDDRQAIQTILNSEPENKPGETVLYSDLGFILLGRIIEYIMDKSIQYAFRDILAIHLGIEKDLFYLTPGKISDTRLIASNKDWKTDAPFTDFINDQNARLFPSGTGHAGLFGNLHGIEKITRLILNGGIWNDQIIIDPEVFTDSFNIVTAKDGSQRAQGWDITGKNTQAGAYFQHPDTRGHLAFTGCGFWFNPARNTAAVLLANRSFTGFDVHKYKNIRRNIFNEMGKKF